MADSILKKIGNVLGTTIQSIKTEFKNELNTKADKASTLQEYGITDAFTKTEIQAIIDDLNNRITILESK